MNFPNSRKAISYILRYCDLALHNIV